MSLSLVEERHRAAQGEFQSQAAGKFFKGHSKHTGSMPAPPRLAGGLLLAARMQGSGPRTLCCLLVGLVAQALCALGLVIICGPRHLGQPLPLLLLCRAGGKGGRYLSVASKDGKWYAGRRGTGNRPNQPVSRQPPQGRLSSTPIPAPTCEPPSAVVLALVAQRRLLPLLGFFFLGSLLQSLARLLRKVTACRKKGRQDERKEGK